MESEKALTLAKPMAGVIARQEFAATQLEATADIAMAAVAAREQAVVQARFLMAERHPRDWDATRVQLLKECESPGFAEVARYARPVGGGKIAKGFSIRFIEVAIRCARNIHPENVIVYDDDRIRIMRNSVTDLESNICYTSETIIPKTVERKKPEGRTILRERINSQGETTYTVSATEEEVRTRQAALRSIAIRDAQRFLPGHLLRECEEKLAQTIAKADKSDPQAAKNRLVDAFAEIGVLPMELINFLGHSLDTLQPTEREELRGLYVAIRDGETTFQGALKMKYGEPGAETEDQHDARLQRQMERQAVDAKILEAKRLNKQSSLPPKSSEDLADEAMQAQTAPAPAELNEEEMREELAATLAREQSLGPPPEPTPPFSPFASALRGKGKP